MIELIDSHCHLDFPVLRAQSSVLLAAAESVGVCQVVVPGVLQVSWAEQQRFCRADGRLFAAFGLHPCFMAQHGSYAVALEQLDELLAQPDTVAVGEIGLDFFSADADRNGQVALFEAQLRLALRHQLPVLLHVRKAHDQVLALLRRLKLPMGGIVHAFSGSSQQAQQYIELGFVLGFGGTVTYERARKIRQLAATLPLTALVLETDGPDMPLAQYRDQPNCPQRVYEVAQEIAQLRGISVEEVAAVTTATARRVLLRCVV